MDTKLVKCGVVSVEFPQTGRVYLKSFPLNEDAAIAFGLEALDHLSTGCGRVHVGTDVISLLLVEKTRDGLWVHADETLVG